MASARRRKRRTANWQPILLIGLACAFVLGLFFSPITSVRSLRVVGAQPHDRQRLALLGQSLRGQPYGRVDVEAFESQVLRGRDVYSVDLSHNVFGSGVVRLKYRKPVAAVLAPGTHKIYLDDHGVLFSSPEPFPNIRKVSLEAELAQPVVAFAQAWPSRMVAELCQKLKSFVELGDAVVHLDQTGRLTLRKENSGSVDLGGTDAMDEKLRKLRQLLDEQPSLLTRVTSLNLVDPDKPAFSSTGSGTK